MIIEKLKQEYACGCGRGMSSFKYEGILNILNSIIQEDIELVPGNVFEIRSITGTKTIAAVDSEDELIQILSETGPFAIKRLAEEVMIPEYEMRFGDVSSVSSASIKKVDTMPEDLSSFSPNWCKFNILKDHLMYSCDHQREFIYEVTFSHNLNFDIPLTVYLTKSVVWYNEEDVMDPEALEVAVEDTLAYLYQFTDGVERVNMRLENIEAGMHTQEEIDLLSNEELEVILKTEGKWPLEDGQSARDYINGILSDLENKKKAMQEWLESLKDLPNSSNP